MAAHLSQNYFMQKEDNLVLIVLCGMSCSGKSTWVEKNTNKLFKLYNEAPIIIISKDNIRDKLFGKNYIIDSKMEKAVNDIFYQQLGIATKFKRGVIIVDNTHCKESHINSYFTIFRMMEYRGQLKIYVRFFDIPLWKAHLRNIWRNFRTGKYTPLNMMRILHNNYKKIDKLKYKRFLLNDI